MTKNIIKFIFSQKVNLFFGVLLFVFILALFNITVQSFKTNAHTGTSCGVNDQENTDGRSCSWSPNNYLFYFSQDGGGYYWTDSVQLRWNQTSANALKSTGHRYTQDNNDGGASGTARFSATGIWGTTFPNPSFDTDDDWGNDCSYANEAEMTSDNANFPTPDTNYLTTFQWQRSCLGTGQMYFTAQLSTWFIEWQTRHWDQLYTKNYSYSGAMNLLKNLFTFISNNLNYTLAHGDRDIISQTKKGVYSYNIQRKISSKEVNINVAQKINSKEDLNEYKDFIIAEARKLAMSGFSAADTVITFNSPQSADVFRTLLEEYKIKVNSFEMRAIGENGEKITIGGVVQDKKIDPIKIFNEIKNASAMKSLSSVELQGITSFTGEIDLNDYNQLSRESSVFLVDILSSEIMNETEGYLNSTEVLDVNLNDVYWYLEEYGD